MLGAPSPILSEGYADTPTSQMQMGNDGRANVLPVKEASGPGFLGPNYNPADEILPPASIGVRRGDKLDDVIGSVKGVIYYGDMIGFGEASSSFTRGMPGLRPLGVNYFINSGLTCSNGATMWEYVETIPTGSALGQKVKQAIRGVGLPQLRGMAPGILEDAKSALDPFPVINAVVGSGYPQCKLVRRQVGDFDGKITNVDGVLLVDPVGLIKGSGGKFYQERWIQDRDVMGPNRPGETDDEHFARSDPIQLSYDNWDKAPKLYSDNGCVKDSSSNPGLPQPKFCSTTPGNTIQLADGSTIKYSEGFVVYRKEKSDTHKLISLSVSIMAVLGLMACLSWKSKK
jgi:hypothetical protein